MSGSSTWIARLRAVVALLILPVFLFVAACDSGSTTDPDVPDDGSPAALTIVPSDGTPGTLFVIEGLDTSMLDLARLRLRMDDLPGTLSLSSTGQLLGAVPLMAAGADGQSPPVAPVDLLVSIDDVVVGRAEAAFTVQALTPAPGSTATLGDALVMVSGELERIVDALAPEPGVEEQWTLALAGALDTLVHGEQPGSLASAVAALAADDPATLALLDAFIAGSGLLDQTQALLAGLQSVTLPTLGKSTFVADVVLARKMQFYALAQLFGETVVHETAETYANTVGLLSGVIGIGADVPGAAIVSAVVAVADFAVNKVLLGVLPATVTDFTLTLEDRDLRLGEITTARLDLTAVNAPPEVGVQDFVGLTLALLGLGANTQTATFAQILESTAAFYLGLVQQLLASYASAHPELGLDVSVSLVPAMSWSTTIHDPRRVDCVSLAPAVIAGLTDQVNWQAGTTQVGSADIYARTAIGPDALLLDLLPGFSYAGVAFGENVVGTPPITVEVSGDLLIAAEFVSVIEPGAFEPVTVWVHYAVEGFDPIPAGGIQIEAIADGGTVSPSTGTTNGAEAGWPRTTSQQNFDLDDRHFGPGSVSDGDAAAGRSLRNQEPTRPVRAVSRSVATSPRPAKCSPCPAV